MCWVGCQPRVELHKRGEQKIRATKINVFKIECCGSYGRLPTGKEREKKICWFLSGIVSEKCLRSCSHWSAHCVVEWKLHLQRLKRERPALVAANVWVWVYKGTVYSTKGTTWSGSPLWKKAQREVRQHWFIYSYISAYIQALYMYCPGLLEYIRLVWPPTRM